MSAVYVKRDYVSTNKRYRKVEVTVLCQAAAACEPNTYLERRGRERWSKIFKEVLARAGNYARVSTFAAMRKGKFLMELEVDGKKTEVDNWLASLIEVADEQASLEAELPFTTTVTNGSKTTSYNFQPPSRRKPRPVLVPAELLVDRKPIRHVITD